MSYEYQVKDWIVFFNEATVGKPYRFVAVGAKAAEHIKGKVMKGGGFHGTYPEAKDYVEHLNNEYMKQFKMKRRYERGEQDVKH